MTEAGWTREAPSKEGWYWMRAPQHGWRDCVVWVDQDEDGFYIDVGDCDSEYVTEIEAEWLGPITPDSYQQGRAEGAHDYRDAIIEELDLDSPKQQEFTRTDVILALAHADDKLAQQAQEGGVGDASRNL